MGLTDEGVLLQSWDLEVAIDDETPVSAIGLLQRLLGALRKISPQLDHERPAEGPDDHPEIADDFVRSLGDKGLEVLEIDHDLRRVIRRLNRALEARSDLKEQADRAVPPEFRPQAFAPVRVFTGRKPIHLGSVDRYFVLPALPPPTMTLAYVMSKIAGTDDLLVREQHDVLAGTTPAP